MRRAYGFLRGCAVGVFVLLMGSQLQAAATVIAALAPGEDSIIEDGELVTIEFFFESDTAFATKGAQMDMYCSLTNGGTSLNVISNGVVVNRPVEGAPSVSLGGIPGLCPGEGGTEPGLYPVSQINCVAASTPPVLTPSCALNANQLYYMVTITYQVTISDCPGDSIVVNQETPEVADGQPLSADPTRIRDNGPGMGNLIPIVAYEAITLTPAIEATETTKGAKHIVVKPPSGTIPVPLYVTGGSGGSGCIGGYVQADGTIGTTPVYQLPSVWNEVDIHGLEIVPNAAYTVSTECGGSPTAGMVVETSDWGDVDDTGLVDIDDLILEIEALGGDNTYVSIAQADFYPCTPNSLVDMDDLLVVLSALVGDGYSESCVMPCP